MALALPAALAGSALGGPVEQVWAPLRDVAYLVGWIGMAGAPAGYRLASWRWLDGRTPGQRPVGLGAPAGRWSGQRGAHAQRELGPRRVPRGSEVRVYVDVDPNVVVEGRRGGRLELGPRGRLAVAVRRVG